MAEQEDDMVLGDPDDSLTTIIDGQLALIATLTEMEVDLYDQFGEDRAKCIIRAMKLIYKAQYKILGGL